MTMKICDCKDYHDNVEYLHAPFKLNLIVIGEYKGKIFEFCPWCGRRLYDQAVPGAQIVRKNNGTGSEDRGRIKFNEVCC